MIPLLLTVAFSTVFEPALFASKLQGEWKITELHAVGIDLTDSAKGLALKIRGNVLTLPDGEKSCFVITRVEGDQASITVFNQHGRPFNGIARATKTGIDLCWSFEVGTPQPKQVDAGKREVAVSFQLVAKP